ncbi:SKP1/BTB/POZ domain-containing protein [Orpheovirus IHUMI-LCC2]|uniref:SKP1/BTB/POZ domain-containing protein n=1 Tax=Orpheovirus IHUMI-LCC2 TaxID=2023057 RepID=A0A2I2L511_9VIRU|nr:SKP1/BTB/POZ domain-containing protein [Orpheovirus IHUMI-LCC2]SNW62606.1 SKP1/BTB/POZ domain-containing protein [Orpheovirus IHUMI-LCC2]
MLQKKDLYNNPTFSDLKIKCNDEVKEWHAHKVIVCTYSNMLYTKFTINMKDKNDDIVYVDWEPSVTEFILRFMYDDNYDINREDYNNMEWKLKLYSACHYWEIPKLCLKIEQDIKDVIFNYDLNKDEDRNSLNDLYNNSILYENIRELIYDFISGCYEMLFRKKLQSM